MSDPSPATEPLSRQIEGAYGDLHELARWLLHRQRGAEPPHATSLVHEAYLRLAGSSTKYRDRGHLLATAARAMRFVLVDSVRRRNALKRAGAGEPRRADELQLPDSVADSADLVAIDEALQALEREMPRKARLVELKFFGGLTNEEVADSLDISLATVKRDWQVARAWLLRNLHGRSRVA